MDYNILLVDDEPTICSIMREAIEMAGYNVYLAHDAVSATDYASQTKPDLLITDLNLPRVNGLQLCNNLRNDYPTMDCIVMTGETTDEVKMNAYKAGIQKVLFKPFGFKELTDAINSLYQAR